MRLPKTVTIIVNIINGIGIVYGTTLIRCQKFLQHPSVPNHYQPQPVGPVNQQLFRKVKIGRSGHQSMLLHEFFLFSSFIFLFITLAFSCFICSFYFPFARFTLDACFFLFLFITEHKKLFITMVLYTSELGDPWISD